MVPPAPALAPDPPEYDPPARPPPRDQVILLCRRRRLRHHRFVERGIEWVPGGIDDLQAMPGKRLRQLLLDHRDAVHDGLRVGGRGVDVREPSDVVERVDEALQHVGLPTPVRILALLRGASAIVVVLRGEAKVLVPLFVERRGRHGRARLVFGLHRGDHLVGKLGVGWKLFCV